MGSLIKSSVYHSRHLGFHLLKLVTIILVAIGGFFAFMALFGEGYFEFMFSSIWNFLFSAVALICFGFYAKAKWLK